LVAGILIGYDAWIGGALPTPLRPISCPSVSSRIGITLFPQVIYFKPFAYDFGRLLDEFI